MLWRPFRRGTVAAVAAASIWSSAAALAAPQTLPASVEAALEHAHVPRQSMVAVVQEAGNSRNGWAWQADLAVNPASLMKLLTTYAALDLLGPAWTWTTPVWLRGPVHDGILDGDLVVKGSGDPKLVAERIWLMLQRVQQSGVRDIRGDIVLDRSAFDVAAQDPGDFDGESLRPYNVVADALMLNYKSVVLTITPDVSRGAASVTLDLPLAGVQAVRSVRLAAGPCDDWRGALQADFSDPAQIRAAGAFPAACGEKVWAVAYADPASYNARALLGQWQALGGQLGGSVRDGLAPATPPTFQIHSPPLAEVVRDVNKFSNNVMAQQLFLTLGLVQRNAGTADAARDVLRHWVSDRWGPAAVASLVIDNGSGLSRSARLSAGLLAQVLQSAWSGPWMPELTASLPVSGVDGTLKHAQAGVGRAHLKTGSLRDVAGVAGYVTSQSGRRYVVVGIINHANAGAAQSALDALVRSVAGEDPPAPAAPP